MSFQTPQVNKLKQQLTKQLLVDVKKVPKPSHNLTGQQLLALDYNTLPEQQKQLLEKLSFFSENKTLLKIVQKQYGESKSKQYFIQQNINFLTTNESIIFSKNKNFYHQHSVVIPAYTIGFCTISAFLIALWRLPSRKSTIKYTLIGMTTGIVTSYVYWKYSMFEYYGKLNGLFRTILMDRYESEKKK